MGELRLTARKLVGLGRGILAADESVASATKRLESVAVPSTAETRRQYRDLFLSAPGIEAYLSGVILFEETMRQAGNDGIPFPDALARRGILPGIKVDQGLVPMTGSPNETVTNGLDGLPRRLEEYRAAGARFAKWRAAFPIASGLPTDACLAENAKRLAAYAAACHAADIVPMVEPEVLLDGDHDVHQSAEVTAHVLRATFAALEEANVDVSAVILKTSMVLAGSGSAHPSGPEEVGEETAHVLRINCPKDLAGIVFLSGGQTPVQATENLQAVAQRGPHPWPVTFSYARALQGPPLEVWRGHADKVFLARTAFLKRLKLNSLASSGHYIPALEYDL